MRILSIFGTRPEAIKMAPLVKKLETEPDVESVVCVTGQHKTMLTQELELFQIDPQYDLAVMTANQSLNCLEGKMVAGLDDVLEQTRPDYVLVHGDTTTAMAGALAAFHRRIPVGHVEAGLRTGNIYEPWPEEMNRRFIDVVSDMMFAPTASSRANLEAEALGGEIVLTGNTVIDALHLVCGRLDKDETLRRSIDANLPEFRDDLPIVLVTGHRRENFNDGFGNAGASGISGALVELAKSGKMQIVYPVHLNPNVRGPIFAALGGLKNVFLTDPLEYPNFVRLMQRAAIILTDSGGVQEEAPALGKPVLVMRDVTERPEAIAAGTVKLVGTDQATIVASVMELVEDEEKRRAFARLVNPYGDGLAAERIIAAVTGREFSPFPSSLPAGYKHPIQHARNAMITARTRGITERRADSPTRAKEGCPYMPGTKTPSLCCAISQAGCCSWPAK